MTRSLSPFRAALRRMFRSTPRPTRRPRLAVVNLEDRVVPAFLFVDFGDRFGTTTTVGALNSPAIDGPLFKDNLGNDITNPASAVAFTNFDTLYTVDAAQNRGEIISLLQRFYEPFNVTVVELTSNFQFIPGAGNRRAAANETEIASILNASSTKDAYVLVGRYAITLTPPLPAPPVTFNPTQLGPTTQYFGLTSTTDIGGYNQNDGTSYVLLQNPTEGLFNPTRVAFQIAHEAGHSFGLNNVYRQGAVPGGFTGNSTHADQISQTEIMSDFARDTLGGFNTYSRYPMILGNGNANYDTLAAFGAFTPADQFFADPNVGANPNIRYVTGTGSHDIIRITRTNATTAEVTVSAFQDAARTVPIAVPGTAGVDFSFTYTIDLSGSPTIVIDAGGRDDRIEIDAKLGMNVRLRGMNGTDSLYVFGTGTETATYSPGMNTLDGLDGNPNRQGLVTTDDGVRTGAITFSEFEDASTVLFEDLAAVTLFGTPGDDEFTPTVVGSNVGATGTLDGTVPLIPLTLINVPGFTINGAGGDDTLFGISVVQNYFRVTGPDSGELDLVLPGPTTYTMNFAGMENLTGGQFGDTFEFVFGGTLTGDIDGGANIGSNNTLIGDSAGRTFFIDQFDSGLVLNLMTGGRFTNIEDLVGGIGDDTFVFAGGGFLTGTIDGGDGSDILQGDDFGRSFFIDGPEAGTINTLLPNGFTAVENLVGGTSFDTFTFLTGGSLSGTIDGGTGTDPLTEADRIVGDDAGRTFTLTDLDAGDIAGILPAGFLNVENLTGGAGPDVFRLDEDGALSGTIDGGPGTGANANTIDYSLRLTSAQVNLATGEATSVADPLLNIQNATGGFGDDTLTASAADNILTGGAGNDVYRFNADSAQGTNTVIDTAGTDTLDFSQGTEGVAVNLSTTAPQFVNLNMMLVLDSGAAIERVLGTVGDDVLTGNTLNNFLQGGLGNDTYRFNADGPQGTNVLSDSGGVDTLDFSPGTTVGVTVNLSLAGQQTINANMLLTAPNIENVIGTAANDVLTGNSSPNILDGGAGNDTYQFNVNQFLGTVTVIDASGTDTLDFSPSTAPVRVDLSLGTQQVHPALNLTIQAGSVVENVFGGAGNDTLTGNAADNILAGGGGNDTYRFNADTPQGKKTIADTAGLDTLDFSAGTVGVAVDLSAVGDQTANGNMDIALLAGTLIENIIGTSGADTLTGNAADNILEGRLGNDTYRFNADTPQGTVTIRDTGGIDTVDFSAGNLGVAVNLGRAAAQQVNANLRIVLPGAASIENLIGTAGNDVLTGNGLANIIVGGAGDDVLAGAGGNDTYLFFADVPQGHNIVRDAGGIDTLDFSAGITTGVMVNLSVTTRQTVNANMDLTVSGVENLIGTAQNDTLTGNARPNLLVGGRGDDLLNGGGGNDTYGFNADDPLIGTDTITDPAGTDTLDFSAGLLAVNVNLGAPGLQVVNANLSLDIQAGTVMENVIGGAGDDVLTAGVGNNILAGGPGNDTYRFNTDVPQGRNTVQDSSGSDTLDFSAGNTGVTVDLTRPTARQQVSPSVFLTLTKDTTVANIIGTNGDDVLIASSANNRLEGGPGDDVYRFNANKPMGTNTIIDTAGRDTLDFSVGTVGVAVDLSNNATVQQVNANMQLFLPNAPSLAIVLGTSGHDLLTGNDGDNVLVGRGGNDTLTGGLGRDILIGSQGSDVLDGGAGDDIVIGGNTRFDTNRAALIAIATEWASAGTYEARVSNLLGTTPGGQNGTFFLRGAGMGGPQTVYNDGQRTIDFLTGGLDKDWFIWSLGDSVPEIPDPNVPPGPGDEIATRV